MGKATESKVEEFRGDVSCQRFQLTGHRTCVIRAVQIVDCGALLLAHDNNIVLRIFQFLI